MADKPVRKVRSGQSQAEIVEAFSDVDEARATGLRQILDENGHELAAVPTLSATELVRMYEGMLRGRLLDEHMLTMQRQGRIGLYLDARGQEAGAIAAAHALAPDDTFVPALREASAALYRGLPLRTYLAQMLGNANDPAHGRQMPGALGSRASRHVIGSSSVASQMPHATGLAWAARMRGERAVVVCFVGDGGTSEDDFQSGLNFAAVFKAPVVFVCQNNQWAISTPLSSQTAARSIAIKGLAFGVPSFRVDGNDVLALYAVIKDTVDRARAGSGPSFVEAVTYRMGAHGPNDDPSRYRDPAEAVAWQRKDPLLRFGLWLDAQKILTAEAQTAARQRIDDEIRAAIAAEETVGPPSTSSLFDDVLAEPSWLIEEQRAEYLRARKRRTSQ
ncbi:MAG: thiamine pyrophosphate-dependent enzyme [Polyangia bacterium]|jgi:pyruvate dehydrogenase E1 component alpha subunit/2-oxoisovalerate dehydrogenase E1 component alpha subunit